MMDGTNPFDDPSITNAVGQTNDFSFDQNIGMEPAPTHPPADEHQPLGLGFSSDDPMNNATVNPPAHMHAQSGASDKNGFTDNSLDFIDQVNNSGTIHDHNDNTNNNTNDPFMLGGSIDLPPQHQHRKSAYEMTGGSINPFGNAADIASSQPAYSSSSSSFEPYTVSLGPGAASGSMQGMGAMSNTMNNDPNTNNTTNDMKNSNAYEAPNLNGNMSMNNNNNMNSNSVNNNNMNVDRMSTEEEQKNAKFYQLAYYQKYFNVTTTLIGKRLLRTYVPTRAFYTPEETPDLYGPFWIATTLIVLMAVMGNFASWIQSAGGDDWEGDFQKVSEAALMYYLYLFVVPLVLYFALKQVEAPKGFVELISFYGYSLFVYIPTSILCVAPSSWLRWVTVTISFLWSTTFLLKNVYSNVSVGFEVGLAGVTMNEVAPNVNERSRSFYIVLASIIIINLVIALVTKIYFFDY